MVKLAPAIGARAVTHLAYLFPLELRGAAAPPFLVELAADVWSLVELAR